MSQLLGIDVGTSGIKAVVFDLKGNTIASSFQEYPLLTPKPQWAEQNPEDWWQATCRACRELLAADGVSAEKILGLSFSGQMHGSVYLDKDKKVVRPCILWCDARTGEECRIITEKAGRENLHAWTSNPALAGFTAPKAIWLQRHEPENFKRVRTLFLPKDYVRFCFTGELSTEVSDNAGTLLFNVGTKKWATELLDVLEIPQDWMPPIYESFEMTGRVSETAARETGLKVGTPVVAGGADNPCAAVGTGVVSEGQMFSSIGSSGVVFAPCSSLKVDPQERVHSFCHSVPATWYLMGVTLTAGLSFRWFRDVLGADEVAAAKKEGVDPYEVLTREAADAPIGAEGLYFLPYLLGERTPHKDPEARGAFVGLTMRHQKPHLVRALLEGITFGLRDSLEIIRAQGVDVKEICATGGGAKSAFWRQLQADVYGQPIVTTNSKEGPALGAAILAGVGVGAYNSIKEACQAIIQVTERVEPNAPNHERYTEVYQEFTNLYPALKDRFKAITRLV